MPTKKTQRVRPTVAEVRELKEQLEATLATVKTQAGLIDEIRGLAHADGRWLSALESKVAIARGLLIEVVSSFTPPPDLARRVRVFTGIDSPYEASRVSQRLNNRQATAAPDAVAGN